MSCEHFSQTRTRPQVRSAESVRRRAHPRLVRSTLCDDVGAIPEPDQTSSACAEPSRLRRCLRHMPGVRRRVAASSRLPQRSSSRAGCACRQSSRSDWGKGASAVPATAFAPSTPAPPSALWAVDRRCRREDFHPIQVKRWAPGRITQGSCQRPHPGGCLSSPTLRNQPQLLDEVKHRARDGCQIALMIPPERHPDASDWTPAEACRLVRRAADDQPVTLVDCGDDAAATIGALAERGGCDEILLSTPPEHHEHWHRHTLPKRLQALGIPVTVIPPEPVRPVDVGRNAPCRHRPRAPQSSNRPVATGRLT